MSLEVGQEASGCQIQTNSSGGSFGVRASELPLACGQHLKENPNKSMYNRTP